MSYQIVDTNLAAAVANAATVAVAYPAGTNAGTFKGAVGHQMVLGTELLTSPEKFTLTFNAADITVTNGSGATWASGSRMYLQLEVVGEKGIAGVKRTIDTAVVYINLGAPLAASADGIAASQTPAAAGNLVLAANQLDVPRNLTETGVAATVAHNLTVTGVDEYGKVVVETITGAVGAVTVSGKKTFKTISKIAVSGATTGAITVGWGDVLGLPLFLQDADFALKEIQDDAVAAAGTFVNGDQAKATATTGDVRGTYDPSAACNGAITFRLAVAVPDPTYKGVSQFAG